MLYKCVRGGGGGGKNLSRSKYSYKTILFGLLISLLLLAMQCSKSGTDEVVPAVVNNVPATCQSGYTLQADGTCKSPDGTTNCPVGESKNAIGKCVAITCTSVQTLNASGQCVAKTCLIGQTLNASNGICEANCPIGQSRNAASLTCADITLTWFNLGPTSEMKTARTGMGTAIIDTKIYAFGGASESTLNNTEVFDITTKIWTTLGPTSNMKIARSKMGFSNIGNKIYVFGGIRDTVTLDSTEVFDTTTNIWMTLGPTSNMKIARSKMGIATIDGTHIYAFGGIANGKTVNSTEVFDTTTNIWMTLEPTSNMKIARSEMGTATIGTHIYAFGGIAKGETVNSTEVFDTTTKIWMTLEPTSNLNSARSSMGIVTIGTKIYAFGGYETTSYSVLYSTEVFDTNTKVWSTLGATSNLNSARYNMGTATKDTKIYVFGGSVLDVLPFVNITEFFVIVP